ncbi:prepilin-type N-terminal cleavage/methylation domain-containing protein [Francisella sp. 19X1-34]|uniref:prepilin-type N-terminal cleavage/methylation domain-containing protein n=1 Tax=Francisella sp. 19X1-34 TaxID=3087177 RepID=UPI002E35E510|nr:prepilin-type N-terminal cleavage/methylation domain-containing protein [Francisella sp. 19X1-34]MED7788494.1 prepilin-type N-terminal cleavage/methylation domain-containing protein [Francisella sp. 19X1-34]
MRKIRGFSLLELIISISVLSFIIAILFVLFKQSFKDDYVDNLSYKFAEYVSAVKTRVLEDKKIQSGSYSGTKFVKSSKGCKGGLADRSYLPCDLSIKSRLQTSIKKQSGVLNIEIKLSPKKKSKLELADLFLDTQDYFEQIDSVTSSKATAAFSIKNNSLLADIVVPYQGDTWIDIYGENKPYANLYFSLDALSRNIRNLFAINLIANPENNKSTIASYMDPNQSVLAPLTIKFPQINLTSENSEIGNKKTSNVNFKYNSLNFATNENSSLYLGSKKKANVFMDDFYVPFLVHKVPFSQLDDYAVNILYVNTRKFVKADHPSIKISKGKYQDECKDGSLVLEASLLNALTKLSPINLQKYSDEIKIDSVDDVKFSKKNTIYSMPTSSQRNITVNQNNFSINVPDDIVSGQLQIVVYCNPN